MKTIKGPSAIEQRLIDGADINPDDPKSILFQHTVLCQTRLPFRDPGDEARTWERLNGNIHLKVLAGEATHPVQSRFVPVGLPFGPIGPLSPEFAAETRFRPLASELH